MKNYILTGLLIGVFFPKIFAQEEIEPGYLVKANGDTIAGFIRYEEDKKLCQRVKFYNYAEDDVELTYYPEDLAGFGFTSGRFFRSVDTGEDSLSYFAKVISSGKIHLKLIRLEDSNQAKFHLSRSDTGFKIDLEPPSKSEVTRNGKNYISHDNVYLGRLSPNWRKSVTCAWQ